jgi:hypothetical protein
MLAALYRRWAGIFNHVPLGQPRLNSACPGLSAVSSDGVQTEWSVNSDHPHACRGVALADRCATGVGPHLMCCSRRLPRDAFYDILWVCCTCRGMDGGSYTAQR